MVVIGAGEAGLRAALTLRDLGFDGAVTVIGGEPHAPYERPPLSKQVLFGGDVAPPWIAGAGSAATKGVRLLLGVEAVAIDRERQIVSTSNDMALPYRRLLIAIGAQARPLGGEGGHLARRLRRLDDALALSDELGRCKSLLVIGGGFIGLELAAAARKRGLAVTVVEAAQILGRATPELVAAMVAGWHEDAGVTVLAGKSLSRISRRSEGFEAEFADGVGVFADLVVAGVGAVPETRLAEAAGLALDNGIAVDGRLQTNDPFIYAAGDCASFPHPLFGGRRLRLEAWRNAQDQGAFVARSLLDGVGEYDAVPWFWSDQYDFTLQVAGLPSLSERIVTRVPADGSLVTFHLDEGGCLVGAAGAGRLGAIAKDIQVAERMISQSFAPDPDALSDPTLSLKAIFPAKRTSFAVA